MPKERRTLTDEEKKYVREEYKNRCYICGLPLDGYDEGEIQYDHIYAHAAEIAGGEELDKFAPIHASSKTSARPTIFTKPLYISPRSTSPTATPLMTSISARITGCL